jgi:hypothetical protein
MAVADLLYGIHGEHTNRVDGTVVDLGPLEVRVALAGGAGHSSESFLGSAGG